MTEAPFGLSPKLQCIYCVNFSMAHLAWELCKVISLLMLPDLFLQCKRNGIITYFWDWIPYCFKTVEAGIYFFSSSLKNVEPLNWSSIVSS